MVSTKQRMVDSAMLLLRERGVNGVTIDAVLALSQTPRGSVYHHFPGGRRELVETAARESAAFMSGYVAELASGSPDQAVSRFVELWSDLLEQSDYRAGCPVAAIASSSTEPGDLAMAADTFDQWRTSLTASLRRAGYAEDVAQSRAVLAVAAVEGAILMCRASRSSAPLQDVAAALGGL